MKREKERLEELRRMPYEVYVQTPEWENVRQAALERVGNRCQICGTDEGSLEVYHITVENLGCEQEHDVLVLCERCYDLCSQAGRLADVADPAGEKVVPQFSFSKRATIFGSSALISVGLPTLLHAPLPAEVAGVVAALLLAVNSPKIYAELRGSLPEPAVEILDKMTEHRKARATTGEWTVWDRLMGRHLQSDPTHDSASDEQQQQDYLDLAPTLKTHADQMLSGRKVILGVSGSGKTNTMNVYCEELGKLKPAPAIILFDTDDENRGLCYRPYLPNPVWLDKSRGLNVKTAFQMAQTIMERRYQCIVNLQSFEEEEAAWVMINMVRGVRAWQEAREVRIPCEIVLDEASVWLPQNPRESLLSDILVDGADALLGEDEDEESSVSGRERASKKVSLLALLQRTFFPIVRRGRRRGIGITLAAQRIAEIDKRALQGSWMFLMRQTQPADWREYRKYGITPEEAMGLRDGEAFVFAPGKMREKHRLRQSDSPHGGITPGMEELRGSVRRRQKAARSPEPAPEDFSPSVTRKQSQESKSSRETALDVLLQLRDKVDERTFLALINALPDSSPTSEVEPELSQQQRTPVPSTSLAGEREEQQADMPWNQTRQNVAPRRLHPVPAPNEAMSQPVLEDDLPVEVPANTSTTRRVSQISDSDLARAYAYYQQGYTGYRKLHRYTKPRHGWSEQKCQDLLNLMKERGLIGQEDAYERV